jgi:hypothetical protein
MAIGSKLRSRINRTTRRVPDVQYQKLVPHDAIEDEIGITQDRHAPMSGIVYQAADLRKETQGVDGGFNGAEYI